MYVLWIKCRGWQLLLIFCWLRDFVKFHWQKLIKSKIAMKLPIFILKTTLRAQFKFFNMKKQNFVFYKILSSWKIRRGPILSTPSLLFFKESNLNLATYCSKSRNIRFAKYFLHNLTCEKLMKLKPLQKKILILLSMMLIKSSVVNYSENQQILFFFSML